jgi:hypothetical protein
MPSTWLCFLGDVRQGSTELMHLHLGDVSRVEPSQERLCVKDSETIQQYTRPMLRRIVCSSDAAGFLAPRTHCISRVLRRVKAGNTRS